MAKRKVYLILNPSHSPCQVVFASLSQIKRDTLYNELQDCVDLECAESSLNTVHTDLTGD